MLVVMSPEATEKQIEIVRRAAEGMCERAGVLPGAHRTVIGLIGDESCINPDHLLTLGGVEKVVPVEEPYKLGALGPRGGEHSVVSIGGVEFGNGHSPVIAGPCAVESYEQVLVALSAVKAAGAKVARAEVHKPRTGPYSFQGLGEPGLEILQAVSCEVGLPFCVEVLTREHIEQAHRYGAACLRIGARNAGNFELLKALGCQSLPVMIKNGMSTTLEEWLLMAEYVANNGNANIILCHRGIRTFETATRNTFDVSSVPMIHDMAHWPIICDPSHGTGTRVAVAPMARAALAAGADGLMIDVHHRPAEALVDGRHALVPGEFVQLMRDLQAIGGLLGLKV